MKIEHLAVYVADLEAVREFFVTYFGATANDLYHNPVTNFRSYFLSFDDAQTEGDPCRGARLELMQRPDVAEGVSDGDRLGYHHIAISVGSTEAVDELSRRLHDDGYPVISGPRTTGDGYYESCVQGIENILIEITI
ncbi:MAG: VOC family protein [Corynebacterium sp.]|uniref:VOC family protein n=1 Tax=Corynebacterium sp. TaxID=1720 RepID=UPI0026DB1B90|nr:VOC family protein [Corynebacterium sp.]MDO5098632.1 VOC family protein [Corynebacterium sp.]